MNTYTITVTYEAEFSPIMRKQLPEESETLTIEAASLDAARRLVPVYSRINGMGRLARYYHNGTELRGNF